MSNLEDTIKKLEVDILEVVGDEFAPKQENGSPERKRLLGLIGKTSPLRIDATQSIRDLIKSAIPEKRDVMENPEHLTQEIIAGRQYFNEAIDQLTTELKRLGLL